MRHKKTFASMGRSGLPPSPPPNCVPIHDPIPPKPLPTILENMLNMYVNIKFPGELQVWMYPTSINGDNVCGFLWNDKEWKRACVNMGTIESIF